MNTSYAKQDRFRDLLMVAAASGQTVYENEIAKLNNMPDARKAERKHSIQDIFRRYWPEFEKEYQGRLRPAIISNVRRMIECRDLSKGYLYYECPVCDNFHIRGFARPAARSTGNTGRSRSKRNFSRFPTVTLSSPSPRN